MKKYKIIFLAFLYFFVVYLFLSFNYQGFKNQLVISNDIIISTVLENADEIEIVKALKKEAYTSSHVLSKYGLENISSLDYLPTLKKFKQRYNIRKDIYKKIYKRKYTI